MWIKERNGKFRLYDRYTAPDGSVHEISVPMDKNTPQAKKAATEALRERVAEMEHDFGTLKYKKLVDTYLKQKRSEWKNSTYIRNKGILEKTVTLFGNISPNKLSAGYIRTCLLEHSENPTTLNEYVRRLKTFLRWAYQNDYLKDTTCFDKLQLWKDKTEREKIQDKYLERDELETLIGSMEMEHWKLLTQFLALSGMRIGEAIALNEDDIDLKTRKISVSKTFDYTIRETTTPKTLDSKRNVHMQPELLAVVKDMKAYYLKLRMITGIRTKFFMFSEDARRLNYDSYRKYLREVSEAALERTITPHVLRHTHVALMAAKGIPLEVLSRRLGHGDSKITKNIYFHITKDLEAADAALFDAVSLL